MRRVHGTRPFLSPTGEVLPGSIAEAGYLRLGDLDQWVLIRGEDVGNPPLIVLHGGPGFPETALLRYHNASLEKIFTVVYWDQRGAGRSFYRDIPASSMTTEQFLADLDELVDHVRLRLDREQAAIFGHSWGSVLGPLYAARHPEKVALYVGAAQIGDWPAAEAASYALAIAAAKRRRNRKALRELRAIGPPPYDGRAVMTERTWMQRLDGQLRPRAMLGIARVALRAPDSSPFDLPRTMRGFRFSLDTMWPAVSTMDLTKEVPELQMPVFFFLGRKDHWVPPATSVAYFEALSAPSKRLVWFEDSGHEMFADEPAKFNALMAELVRPLL
ncbi:MAG TPA: alpha/beta hydrolase [Tepidiformaceae bacterium]|nr:alpha/beta hydrolase [Tepidiformaceae bacterium]